MKRLGKHGCRSRLFDFSKMFQKRSRVLLGRPAMLPGPPEAVRGLKNVFPADLCATRNLKSPAGASQLNHECRFQTHNYKINAPKLLLKSGHAEMWPSELDLECYGASTGRHSYKWVARQCFLRSLQPSDAPVPETPEVIHWKGPTGHQTKIYSKMTWKLCFLATYFRKIWLCLSFQNYLKIFYLVKNTLIRTYA